MKAGTYYIGDLCYVLEKEWDLVCSVVIEGETVKEGEMQLPDGREFSTYCTTFGDGSYLDQYERNFDVDSGTIGCIKVQDIDSELLDEVKKINLGQIVNFDRDFTTGKEGGIIYFGTVSIDTDPEEDWEEDEDID